MSSNGRRRLGMTKALSLKHRHRQESQERRSSAREEAIDEFRSSEDVSDNEFEPELWIDDHFKQILQRLVRQQVEAESNLYALQERIKRLEHSDLHFARIHAHLLIVTFFAPLENEVLVIYSKRTLSFFKKTVNRHDTEFKSRTKDFKHTRNTNCKFCRFRIIM